MAEMMHAPYPDFICIGQQKAATNWLYDQLASHSRFWMPPVKELHFFDRGFNFERAFSKFDRSVRAIEKGFQFDRESVEFFRRALVNDKARAQYEIHLELISKRRKAANGGKIVGLNLSNSALNWYGSLFSVAPADRLTGDITPGYSTLDDDSLRAIRKKFPDTRVIVGLRRPVERLWSQVCQSVRRNSGVSETEAVRVDRVDKLLKDNPHFIQR